LVRLAGLFTSLLVSLTAQAGPRVTIDTHFDQDIAGLDQMLQLNVKVTIHGGGSIEQIELPHSPALLVVGTSQTESSNIVVRGFSSIDSAHTTNYRLSLRPLKLGDYALTPARVVSGGQATKGSAVHVKIVAAGQGPAPSRQPQQQNPFGNIFGQGFPPMPGFPGGAGGSDDEDDPFAQLFGGGRQPSGEDVLLSASLDKKKVVLGQQVTYSIRLYTRDNVAVSEFSDLKLPGFDGFWGEDLETPTRPVPKAETIGGVPYEVYLLKKKALFPNRAGAITIGPAELDVTVGLGFFRGRKLHRESPTLTVDVSPLPDGAPPTFSATNVGQWVFSAKLVPASVPVGEPATLSLSVDGIGNLHGLTLPALPPIPGLRAYDPTSTDKVAPQADRFGGRRQVDVILIPQRTGEFEIPPLTFQWYDPSSGYQSSSTPKLSLRAGVGTNAGAAPVPAGQNVLESTFHPLRDDGRLLQTCSSLTHRLPAPFTGWPFVLGFGFPPLALGAGAMLRSIRQRRAQAAPALRGRRAYRVARQKLNPMKTQLTVAAIAQALFGYLDDRLGEPMAGLSFPDLRQRLIARGFDEGTVRSTLAAFELAESLRYMPEGNAQVREVEKLRSMVEFALEALERASLKPSKPPQPQEAA
jgi:BatD DUF11 like domain